MNFGRTHEVGAYTEAEWYDALEKALGKEYVNGLREAALKPDQMPSGDPATMFRRFSPGIGNNWHRG